MVSIFLGGDEFLQKTAHSLLRRNSPAREDANRIVKLSKASLILFSFKYPFPLDLETDQEKDGINDTFPHGTEWDKPQCVVNQQCRDEKLAETQGIITENDLDIFRIIVEYLFFVNGKIIQGGAEPCDDIAKKCQKQDVNAKKRNLGFLTDNW